MSELKISDVIMREKMLFSGLGKRGVNLLTTIMSELVDINQKDVIGVIEKITKEDRRRNPFQ